MGQLLEMFFKCYNFTLARGLARGTHVDQKIIHSFTDVMNETFWTLFKIFCSILLRELRDSFKKMLFFLKLKCHTRVALLVEMRFFFLGLICA